MQRFALDFEDVWKSYPQADGRERHALRGVTTRVEPGLRVAIVGRSGSGKSTFLHLAAGIDEPSRGEVSVLGRRLSELGERERTLQRREEIGLVFQFFHLLPHLDVLDNVVLPALIAGDRRRDYEARGRELLGRVGLEDRAGETVEKLSGGEMQRVAICRALLRRPSLLLADEPTGNLDDDTGRRVMDLLLRLVEDEASTLIYVTHSADLAALADQTWRLRSGVLEKIVIGYFVKSLRAHFSTGRALFVLSVLGVALGVASVLSIQIINRNALGAFEGTMRAISGEADFSVLGRTPSIPEALYPRVLADEGVAGAWPLYRLDVALAGEDEIYLEILGFDLFAPVPLPWTELPDTQAGPLRDPGWAAVSPELAARRGWAVGTPFEVTSGSRRVPLQVGALVDFRSITPLASSRMVVMDIAQAQNAFGGRGVIHQIDVQVREGWDLDQVKTRLSRDLGTAVQLFTPEQRRQEASGLLGAFRLNLTALSLVSVFVGGFLIYSSTQASLARRRNEFGLLLRSVGATRGQTLGLILSEVALLGAIGVLLGLPLGYAAASLSVERISATLTNLYLLEEIETLRLPAWLYALAGTIGVGGAIAGALLPAVDVSRRDTRSLLVAYTVQERTGAGALRLFLAGCLILALGLTSYLTVARDWRPSGFALCVVLLVGMPLMTPWAVRQATRGIKTRGFGLLYGIKALGLRLQTTSFAIAALGVAVSMLIGITLMVGSFRRTVEIWIQSTLNADVYISTQSWSRSRGAATLDDALVQELGSLHGVVEMDRLRQLFVYSGGRRISFIGVDMGLSIEAAQFELLEGDLATALRRCREEGAVIITEPLSRKAGLGVGDMLRVVGPSGEVGFPIAGVSYDYGNEAGGAAAHLSVLESAFGPGSINNVALYLEERVDPELFADGLKARFADLPLVIRSERALRDQVFEVFDQTFAIARLLQAISLLIAVCGVTLTLIVLARERISELALYRALGARRRQIFRVFLGKGLGMALFGLGMGAGGGLALALILILIINRVYFGWTIAFHWPWVALAEQALTIVAASALASLYPALRASRTPATELSLENL